MESFLNIQINNDTTNDPENLKNIISNKDRSGKIDVILTKTRLFKPPIKLVRITRKM